LPKQKDIPGQEENMRLTEKTRIDALLKTYPFLLDFPVTLTPKFSKRTGNLQKKSKERM
jgi:hypothetical protein